MFALLGPNGAGKTTAIHILSTLISADAGEVRIAGFDVAREPDAVRGVIGLTGQISAVDGQFTGEENLRLMADLNHLGKEEGRRGGGAARAVRPRRRRAKPAMTYSGGMRRRLDLAMTLVGDPRIIFLDEPTTGLDPRSRRVMWDIVRDLVAGRVTILLTTQYLEEADRLAGRIALLDGGRIVAQGTPAELKRLVPAAASGSSSATTAGWTVRPRHRRRLARRRRARPRAAERWRRPLAARPARRLDASVDRGRRAVRPIGRPRRRLPVPHRPRQRPPRRGGADAMNAYVLTDSRTMLRRSLRRMRRYPSLDVLHRGDPGRRPAAVRVRVRGTLGAGLGVSQLARTRPAGREAYIAYIVPGSS